MPFSFTEAPIASRQNRRIVGLCKLADRGERERTGLFRFDGVKLLCEAVRREVPLTAVFVRAGSAGRVTERMAELYGLEPDALGCPAYAVENSLFDRISEENAPEGVICVAKALDKWEGLSPRPGRTRRPAGIAPGSGQRRGSHPHCRGAGCRMPDPQQGLRRHLPSAHDPCCYGDTVLHDGSARG